MTAYACGKVILLGEHAVVYDRPALAAGLAHGARADFHAELTPGLTLAIEPWHVRVAPGDGSELGAALRALVSALPEACSLRDGVLQAMVELPSGGGLGSSAAIGVAVSRAFGEAVGYTLTFEETARCAVAWETVFHGNPSGIDHTVAAHGGAGVFRKSAGFKPVHVPADVTVLFGDTGERTATRTMVEQVARIHARKPETTEQTFDAIGTLVDNGVHALAAGDLRALGQLMDLDQHLLSSLLLSTERTEALCAAAREAGAYGAKLTGGGGGGCVIALAPESRYEAVESAWRAIGAPTFRATIESTKAVHG